MLFGSENQLLNLEVHFFELNRQLFQKIYALNLKNLATLEATYYLEIMILSVSIDFESERPISYCPDYWQVAELSIWLDCQYAPCFFETVRRY